MSGCPLGAGRGNVHFMIYILVLDIYSQQLGGICHLDKYIWVSGLGNVRFVIYIFVLDICCQQSIFVYFNLGMSYWV